MKNHKFSIVLMCTATLLVTGAFPAAAQDPVIVQWFVGLGTGGGLSEQIAAQEQVVADFNASHDDIQIELIVTAPQSSIGPDTLAALIADGTPPDIVGPTTGYINTGFG